MRDCILILDCQPNKAICYASKDVPFTFSLGSGGQMQYQHLLWPAILLLFFF
jgi:hypothetical protein